MSDVTLCIAVCASALLLILSLYMIYLKLKLLFNKSTSSISTSPVREHFQRQNLDTDFIRTIPLSRLQSSPIENARIPRQGQNVQRRLSEFFLPAAGSQDPEMARCTHQSNDACSGNGMTSPVGDGYQPGFNSLATCTQQGCCHCEQRASDYDADTSANNIRVVGGERRYMRRNAAAQTSVHLPPRIVSTLASPQVSHNETFSWQNIHRDNSRTPLHDNND